MTVNAGVELIPRLGAALTALQEAVGLFRDLDQLTSSERRRLNEHMDDLVCETERIKGAYTRLLERAGQPQGVR